MKLFASQKGKVASDHDVPKSAAHAQWKHKSRPQMLADAGFSVAAVSHDCLRACVRDINA